MVETREKTIKDKVFTKTDIRNIWGIFNSQPREPKTSYFSDPSLEVQIICRDETRYESENDELFSDGDIIDLKRVESISIKYRNFKEDKKITIDLMHGNRTYYNNKLTVKGKDKDWVAGVFSRFETLLSSVKPQQHWFLSYKSLFLLVGTVFFVIALLSFFTFIEKTSQYIIFAVLFTFPGLALFSLFIDWVIQLWPSVEFDFGPEHQKVEKNRRIRLGTFFTIAILPLLYMFIPLIFGF